MAVHAATYTPMSSSSEIYVRQALASQNTLSAHVIFGHMITADSVGL